MSIRWLLVAVAGFLVADCGSSDADNTCQDGYTSKSVCVQCGVAGGCGKSETKCARNCSSSTDCNDPPLFCYEGVCQVGGCI